METTNKRLKETRTANVLWTPYGEEQSKVCKPSTVELRLLAALVTGAIPCSILKGALDASADLLWRLTTNWRAGCERFACPVRRRGAKLCFVPTPILDAQGGVRPLPDVTLGSWSA